MTAPSPLTATQRLEQALAAIAASGDEGPRIFTHVDATRARSEARAADERAAQGLSLGPLDGRIVSVKDLLDVAGQVTTAGSRLLQTAAPAQQDAEVVQRLRRAGAVVIGKTNMTEFAFSGVGINPHYGTPGNAHDAERIPGGSSSGAGVSVARGMAEIAIGSDTGGSIRIPSALNGLVGFKPTQARVPLAGAFPLSFTLDTLGPLATSVADAAAADSVLAGIAHAPLPARSVQGLRLGIPRGLLFTETEDAVLQAFEQAAAALRAAGARVSDESLDAWLGAPFTLQEKGTLVAAEAAFIHERHVAEQADAFDPIVLGRIRRGQGVPASHYVAVQQARRALLPQLDHALADVDALILPTVPFVAPRIAEIQDEAAFLRVNALVLRNPSVFNLYDLPALSLPLPRAGQLPVGLMVVGRRHADRELLAVGAALEALFAR
ncbi:MAG: 2-amino-5-chloromuconic acid deaminase [Paracidovorax wautersii]|uniref:2-amino-5-chloromuconic acid deaminase n=1 Tax=Paracidovorax wautersii TaxID=1177982 RepID=A0A7V8JSE8_9BURK|nr:MAG: 2-amino-5-chloromuconic acid deaminase [Paracidovorax wautersii]